MVQEVQTANSSLLRFQKTVARYSPQCGAKKVARGETSGSRWYFVRALKARQMVVSVKRLDHVRGLFRAVEPRPTATCNSFTDQISSRGSTAPDSFDSLIQTLHVWLPSPCGSAAEIRWRAEGAQTRV